MRAEQVIFQAIFKVMFTRGNVFDLKGKLFFVDARFVYMRTVKTHKKTFSVRKHYPLWKLLKTLEVKR